MMVVVYYWNVLRLGQEPVPKNYLMNISTAKKYTAEEEVEKWKSRYPEHEFYVVRTLVLDCTLLRRRK